MRNPAQQSIHGLVVNFKEQQQKFGNSLNYLQIRVAYGNSEEPSPEDDTWYITVQPERNDGRATLSPEQVNMRLATHFRVLHKNYGELLQHAQVMFQGLAGELSLADVYGELDSSDDLMKINLRQWRYVLERCTQDFLENMPTHAKGMLEAEIDDHA